MKNRLNLIFSLLSIFLISLPAIFFNFKGTVSAEENRNFSPRPFVIKDSRFNAQIFREYDSYIRDRFGFRRTLIHLNNFLNKKIQPKILFNGRAMQGKNGFYFYIDSGDGNNLADFQKTNLLSDEQKNSLRKNIVAISEYFREKNIRTIFLICPNKHSVYEEFYPFSRPDGITRAMQIQKIFEEEKINFIFPLNELLAQKKKNSVPLYFETDTHWNSLGAFYASKILNEKIRELFPEINFPQIEYETEISSGENYGDILPMLLIKNAKSTQIKFTPKIQNEDGAYQYEKKEGVIATKSKNRSLPRALIFRDSFFSSLEPFVSPNFSDAEYKWKQFNGSDLAYIDEFSPDLIIFENVERYSAYLAGKIF